MAFQFRSADKDKKPGATGFVARAELSRFVLSPAEFPPEWRLTGPSPATTIPAGCDIIALRADHVTGMLSVNIAAYWWESIEKAHESFVRQCPIKNAGPYRESDEGAIAMQVRESENLVMMLGIARKANILFHITGTAYGSPGNPMANEKPLNSAVSQMLALSLRKLAAPKT